MSTSPTQLSLKKLRLEGWTAWVVEHWNSFARIRQDLFGFADIIAIKEGQMPLLIQCTTVSNMSARVKKIEDNVVAPIWGTIGRIEVWGWYKFKGKWQVKMRWWCKDTLKFSEKINVSA